MIRIPGKPIPLTFLRGKRLNSARNELGYFVRVFRPKGQYPRLKIFTPDALFWADEDIVFSIVKSKEWSQVNDDIPYTEMDWLTPNELRFLASILLCEKRDEALIIFYPIYRYAPRIARKSLNLTKEKTGQLAKQLIMRTAIRGEWRYGEASLRECFTQRYDLVDSDRFNIERQQIYWEKIAIDDYVLLRGLGSLIKAEMLARHEEFWEEATIIVFIALESTFQLILRKLRTLGNREPNAHDAAKWLYENFDKPFDLPMPTVEKYFEEFYKQRIMTLHPSSRYGETPYAPLMYDDYMHLRRSIREIFSFLVAGDHGPDFHADVAQHRKFTRNS